MTDEDWAEIANEADARIERLIADGMELQKELAGTTGERDELRRMVEIAKEDFMKNTKRIDELEHALSSANSALEEAEKENKRLTSFVDAVMKYDSDMSDTSVQSRDALMALIDEERERRKKTHDPKHKGSGD